MIKLSMIPRYHRRLAALAGLIAAPFVAAAGQTIGVNAGATSNVVVAPNAKLTVPIIVDLSLAGPLNIAGLQSNITWGTARLTLDSIRAVTIAGWSFTPNTSGAASGSSLFAAFGTSALGATSTIANAFFTASAATGGTRVVLDPTTAVSDVGANILSSIRPRSLDVCVGVAAKWGDVNDDGVVNISDAQQVGRFSIGLSVVNLAAVLARGDVNADGTINITDAQQIARFSVGLSASPRLGTDVPIVPAATSISVTPSTAQTLVIGSSRQVNATPVNGATDLSGCAPVTWGTSNAAVATVNSTGYVSALSAGTANITATSAGFTSQVTFNVTAVPVQSVIVVLAPTAIQVGTTTTATATTRDGANNVLTGRVVTWSSSNTARATVNATTGVVTGVSAGSATIFATSEGITGSATITVTTGVPTATVTVALGQATINTGATTTATATPRDAGNNILTGRVVTWSSSNTGVATVNASTGVVTGVTGGTANIIATVDGINGQATVTVNAVPVASVSIALGSSSITVGATTQATATTRDAANNVLTGRVVSFTSNNSAVATVGAINGIVTGVAAGTATIFATSEGVTGQVTVTVTASGSVATVQVSLGSSNVQVGGTTTAVATLRDASNNVVSGPVTWSSTAPSIASIGASTGAISALAAGQTTITATSGTKTGSANLTTTLTPVASVTVSIAPGTIIVGGTATATARAFAADGTELFGRSVTWTTSSVLEATVNASGLITGTGEGGADITATIESRTGFAEVNINVAPVATVSLTLTSPSINVGSSTNSTVVARDANNVVLSNVSCTYTSSNTARATVNSSGVVTGVSAGSATITATCDGIAAQATLTVQAPPGSFPSGTSIPANTAATVVSANGNGSVQIPANALASATVITVSSATNAQAIAGTVFDFGPNGTSFGAQQATISITYAASAVPAGGDPSQFRIHRLSGSTWTPIPGSVNTTTRVVTGTTNSFSTYAILQVAAPASNEPAGMTLLAERPFNCVKPTACESTWYYGEDYANAAVSVLSSDAPRSANTTTSGNVVQQNYTPQLIPGSSPASLGTGLPAKQTVYLSMWMKMSDNYVGHGSGVNKVIHFYTAARAGGSNIAVFIIRGSGMGPLLPSFGLQNLGANYQWTDPTGVVHFETVANLDPNVAQCVVTRGQWAKYEMVLTSNTAGVSDGKVELWMNGTKCLSYTGIPFAASGTDSRWIEMNWSPTYGGAGGTITTSFFTQVDHIYVSGK